MHRNCGWAQSSTTAVSLVGVHAQPLPPVHAKQVKPAQERDEAASFRANPGLRLLIFCWERWLMVAVRGWGRMWRNLCNKEL